MTIGRFVARYGPPAAAFATFILAWEAIARLKHIPPFVLPAPSLVVMTLVTDRATLFASLWVTVKTTFAALAAAAAGGSLLAILFSQWKSMERALLPFAVVLQVTPIIAIAPLLLIYFAPWQAVLTCAFLVAFFPIPANCSLGLASADRNLVDLFLLYGASRWQTLVMLKLPAARCLTSSRDLGLAAAWRSSALSSPNSRPVLPGRRPGLRSGSSKRATGFKFRACSPR